MGRVYFRPGWTCMRSCQRLREVEIFRNAAGPGHGLLLSVTWPRFYGTLHLGAISGLHRSWLVGFSAVGPLAFSLSKAYLENYNAAVGGCLALSVVLGIAAVKADNPSLK